MAKPKIRFNGYTEDWEQRKLGEVFKEYSEKNHTELPALTIIQGGGTVKREESDRNLMYDESNLSNYKMVRKDDFIVHLRSFEGGLEKSLLDGIISPAYHTFHSDVADSRFYYPYFRSHEFIKHKLVPHVYGIRDGRSIDIAGMKTIEIPYTSIEEQRKIGDYLESLDHLITLHQRKCEQTKTLKKYMFQKMFPQDGEKVPQIRFEGFTEDWEQRKLGDVAEYRNGKAHENEIDDDGEYIVVNSKFVSTNGEIKKFSNAQNEPLYENEIAFVLSDVPNGRAIARTFLIEKSGKYTLNQRIAGITPHEDTDPYYLHIKMNRNAYFLKFDDGNKQTNLSIKDVLNYEDMYPNYKEQQKIGNYFRSLDHLITLHQRKCDELKEVKKFMLQNMFV